MISPIHFLRACLMLIVVTLISLPYLTHADTTIISEDYESYVVGTGTYSGSWKFIHADMGYNTGTVTNLDITSDPLAGIQLYSGSIYAEDSACWANVGITGSLASPVGGNYLFLTTYGVHGVRELIQSGNTAGTLYTTDPWESPNGHFYRTEMLQAGKSYRVQLWR